MVHFLGAIQMEQKSKYFLLISMFTEKRAFVVLQLVLLLFSVKLYPQSTLFNSNVPFTIELVADYNEIFNDRNPENAKYHNAILVFQDSISNYRSINVKLKTRGIFRRSRENCKVPPLTVKFELDTIKGKSVFEGYNKLKLVNVCQIRDKYEQLLIKEYYVYRIYNIITDYSFRVRLVRVLYIDREGNYSNFSRYGFLIEDFKSLALRNNTCVVKTKGITQFGLDRNLELKMAFFQYMIGNTDWSVSKLHNIKLLYSEKKTNTIAVPYDFDFCGFVNPPYTKPPDIIPITNVRERYYRGACREDFEFTNTAKFFLQKKDEIYSLFRSDTLLTARNKSNIMEYLDAFFEIMSSESSLKREIIRKCREN